MAVFVLDRHQKPLMPCSEKRARLLLARGRARIHKRHPFTIRLVDRLQKYSALQPLRLKLDPGAKTTGVAITLDGAKGVKVIFLGEIVHKPGIKAKLKRRHDLRRSRRNRKTRYRKPRFQNRRRPKGWLPPSLEARVGQTMEAVAKLRAGLPVTTVSTEHVKFDTQRMQDAEISGVEYQQGELVGYEIREYLLEKWNRQCAYCDAEGVPLEIEHVHPKCAGGSDRVSNLVVACHTCNQAKGDQWLETFLERDKSRRQRVSQNATRQAPHDTKRAQELRAWETNRLERIRSQLKAPLKDAARMNATRWRLYERLKETSLPVECGTGARTKKQRIEHGFAKEHYWDALCVGAGTPGTFASIAAIVQIWSAKGRGTRQMCRTDKRGFPIAHRQAKKQHFGFQTGDMAKATVPKGKYQGIWWGRVAARSSGSFDLSAHGTRVIQGVSHKYFKGLQRNDGWQYETKRARA